MAEYFSFEKVLKELQLDEEELKRMVSEGQIRAFRDDDKMKFRGDDIESMKKGRQTDPTIILPGSGVEADDGGLDLDEPEVDLDEEIALVEDDTSETLLDLDDVTMEEEPVEAGADTLAGDLMLDDEPELALDEDDEDQIGTQPMEAAVEETFVDEDEEVGMTTEPLELVDEEEEYEEKPKTVVATKRETQRAPVRSGRTSARAPVAQVENPGWVVAIIAASLLLLYTGLFAIDMMAGPGGVGGMTEPVARQVSESFLDEPWMKDKAGFTEKDTGDKEVLGDDTEAEEDAGGGEEDSGGGEEEEE